MTAKQRTAVVRVLKDAYGLLSSSKKWTKRTNARNEFDKPVPCKSKKAVSFCLVGAICQVSKNLGEFNRAIDVLKHPGFLYVTGFNDEPTTTFRDIRKKLRDAIKAVGA